MESLKPIKFQITAQPVNSVTQRHRVREAPSTKVSLTLALITPISQKGTFVKVTSVACLINLVFILPKNACFLREGLMLRSSTPSRRVQTFTFNQQWERSFLSSPLLYSRQTACCWTETYFLRVEEGRVAEKRSRWTSWRPLAQTNRSGNNSSYDLHALALTHWEYC